MTDGTRATATAAEVRAALDTWRDGKDEILLWSAYDGVAKQLGVNLRAGTTWAQRAATTFRGQVRGALGRLVTAGDLVKVGQDNTGPDGYRLGRLHADQPRYFTPAGYEKAKRDHQAAETRRATERGRCEQLWDDLMALGLPPEGDSLFDRGKPPQLSAANMSRLITMARRGADHA